MKTKLTKTEFQILLVIDPFGGNPDDPEGYVRDYIRISKSKKYGGEGWSPAEINWSAIGATTRAKANAMGAGLRYAAAMATMMDEFEENFDVETEVDNG